MSLFRKRVTDKGVTRTFEHNGYRPKLATSVKRNAKEKPGTVLKRRIKEIPLVGSLVGGCSSCNNLAKEMDRNGCDWCDDNFETLVTRIQSNHIIAKMSPESKIREYLKWAIDTARQEAAEKTTVKGVRYASNLQNRIYEEWKQSTRAPHPFTSPPVFNLVWHFWPVPGTWQWHVEKLNEIIPQIDGQIIIGLAIDSGTSTAKEVQSMFSRRDKITFIESVNHSVLGEVVTTEPAFQMLDVTQDSVTLYGHAKGVRSHTRNSDPVRVWTESMYECVTFNLERTVEKMSEGFDMFGAFRTFGPEVLNPRHNWHYSGTFFNFRTQALLKNGVPKFQQKYGGVEAWPGDHIPLSKSWCEFRDNSPFKFQYDANLSPQIMSSQLHWESERKGGVKMEQHLREYQWLVSKLQSSKKMLIIGSRHGGLEHHLPRDIPNLKTVSIDPEPLDGNTSPNLYIGSSHDSEIQRQVKSNHYDIDAVFIDGDHSAEGVRKDWEFAKSCNPRQIFFHDFTNATYHLLTGCEVHKVVPIVKAEADANGWSVSSKAVGCGWGGILEVDMR